MKEFVKDTGNEAASCVKPGVPVSFHMILKSFLKRHYFPLFGFIALIIITTGISHTLAFSMDVKPNPVLLYFVPGFIAITMISCFASVYLRATGRDKIAATVYSIPDKLAIVSMIILLIQMCH